MRGQVAETAAPSRSLSDRERLYWRISIYCGGRHEQGACIVGIDSRKMNRYRYSTPSLLLVLFFVPASPSWAGFLALRASNYAPTAFKADYVISLARMVCASGHRGRADLIVWMVGAEGDNCRASGELRTRQFLSF